MEKNQIKINPLPHSENAPTKKEVGQLSLDIYKTEDELVILAPIAGISKKDLEISLTDEILIIKGERSTSEEVAEENYYTKECFWGAFSRSIVLPEEADTQKIIANFNHNVLEIRIPLKKREQSKIIKIKTSEEE